MRSALNAVILLGWIAGALLAAHAITSSGTIGLVLGVVFLVGSLATAIRLVTLNNHCIHHERLLRKHNIDPRSAA